MYIELFLLDNLLMNLLIVRLAAALLSVRPPLYRQLAAGALSAAYAAIAAYLVPALAGVWARPIPLAITALALPARNARGFLSCAAATLFATFAVGGAVCCAALLTGGSVNGGWIRAGIPLRAALLGALAACFLPRAARGLLRRRIREGLLCTLTVIHRGVEHSFTALVDTGCSLTEPVTGLPVALVRCPYFIRFAALPVRAVTASGEAAFYAFRPDRVLIDGTPADCLVAVCGARMRTQAIVPPQLCPRVSGH